MAEVLIEGILCRYRDLIQSSVDEDGVLIEGEEILYADLPQDDQYFIRIDNPFTDDDLVDISQIEFSERVKLYSSLQKKWVEKEELRMEYGGGVYVMIEGNLTYLPASYWGYINHWVLEHGDKPDYREADRIFFVFMEYLYFETEVLGNTRGKGRRQGASSLGYYFQWWICGRKENKVGGSISFNDTAAQKNFQTMFMKGFKEMLPCFVRDFDSSAENFVRFVKALEKGKKGVVQKRHGLNSYVGHLPNSINSYDSGRVSFGVFDEIGKYGKMDINTYWSKVSPTLKIGRNKVGFAYMPTTVNPAKQGGENFEKFWKESDQNAINPTTGEPFGLNTPHKVVRYFVPATEGYAGCIDKFGKSVIDDPVTPVMGNDGKWITEGSLSVILNERALKTGEQLLEHRRDFPLDQYDMFAFQFGQCEFNEENIQKQIRAEEDNPSYWRKARLVIKKETVKSIFPNGKDKVIQKVDWMDDEKGLWQILEAPNKPNKFDQLGQELYPTNKMMYQIGVDTTQDRIAIDGSNPAIIVFKKSCIINGEETGLYPVAISDNPTRLDIHFDQEVLKACMWYGCTVNYEIDRRTDFWRFFCNENAREFLEWTPKILMNPLKPNKQREYGTRSGDPFQLAQMLQISKWYMDGDSNTEYNGHTHRIRYIPLLKQALRYDHLDRTKSDLFVALQMALAPVFGEIQNPIKPMQVKNLFPTYKIKKYG